MLSPDGRNGTRCQKRKADVFLAANKKSFLLTWCESDGVGQMCCLMIAPADECFDFGTELEGFTASGVRRPLGLKEPDKIRLWDFRLR